MNLKNNVCYMILRERKRQGEGGEILRERANHLHIIFILPTLTRPSLTWSCVQSAVWRTSYWHAKYRATSAHRGVSQRNEALKVSPSFSLSPSLSLFLFHSPSLPPTLPSSLPSFLPLSLLLLPRLFTPFWRQGGEMGWCTSSMTTTPPLLTCSPK